MVKSGDVSLAGPLLMGIFTKPQQLLAVSKLFVVLLTFFL